MKTAGVINARPCNVAFTLKLIVFTLTAFHLVSEMTLANDKNILPGIFKNLTARGKLQECVYYVAFFSESLLTDEIF